MKWRNDLGPVRWVVIPVIAIDTLMTLLGQPASYWHTPATGQEGNPFFAWFLVRGLPFFLVTSAGYIAGAFALASLLPRRLALIALLGFILGHYLGASTWMLWHFQWGMSVPILYGIAIATALTTLGLDTRRASPAS